MSAWRIGGSIFQGHWRPGRVLLCVLGALAVLVAGDAKLRPVQARPLPPFQSDPQSQPQSTPQAGSQSASQPQSDAESDTPAAAQPDSPSDANSDLNSPPPVLPTDPPGWKPDPPAAIAPVAKAAPAASIPVTPVPAKPPPAPKPAEAAVPGPPKPALLPLPADPRQRQVAIECNDLMQMATDLKAAMDKSTKDELSVDVVRKAGEIEQYARKVRTGIQLNAGKQ